MIIDGKKIANDIQSQIARQVIELKGRKPCLAVIQVGDNPASTIYIKRKREACQAVGMTSLYFHLPESTPQNILGEEINSLNRDPAVDGILVQLPLPHQIAPLWVNEKIAPDKDVDGLNPINMGKLFMGDESGFVPCTPLGIRELLEKSSIPITGKHVVILGRSLIVGKPLAALLMQNTSAGNASVTVLHKHSERIPEITRTADIIVTAMGDPRFLIPSMVKKGACVIDVGINRINDTQQTSGYRIVGDADFEALKNHCSAITPVPGGVGPMTISMLLSNTLKSYQNKHD